MKRRLTDGAHLEGGRLVDRRLHMHQTHSSHPRGAAQHTIDVQWPFARHEVGVLPLPSRLAVSVSRGAKLRKAMSNNGACHPGNASD